MRWNLLRSMSICPPTRMIFMILVYSPIVNEGADPVRNGQGQLSREHAADLRAVLSGGNDAAAEIGPDAYGHAKCHDKKRNDKPQVSPEERY